LFGAFFINEDVYTLAVDRGSLDAFRPLGTGTVRAAQWAALVEARTSVLG